MNKMEFWEFMIDKFAEHQKMLGYKDSTIRTRVRALKRLLREFGDLSNVDENMIWQKYSNKSKHLRKSMQQSLRIFKEWLNGGY